jgi:hypothetical protein
VKALVLRFSRWFGAGVCELHKQVGGNSPLSDQSDPAMVPADGGYSCTEVFFKGERGRTMALIPLKARTARMSRPAMRAR